VPLNINPTLPKPSAVPYKQPTVKSLVKSESLLTPTRPVDKKPLAELSIDEINKIIDERILRVRFLVQSVSLKCLGGEKEKKKFFKKFRI